MSPKRRFPPPWSVEEGETYFVVKNSGGQKLGFDDPRSAAEPLTRDEARRIAANVAKLRTCESLSEVMNQWARCGD